MPFSFRTGINKAAISALSFFNIYSWLNHFPFSKSNFAPALLQWLKLNNCTNSSNDMISWSLPGFHPNKARKLITASGKYPDSRYPDDTSPVLGSCHSNGNTGKPRRSPSRLLSFPFPSGFNNNGRWANSGIVSSQPKARYNNTCKGAEGNHSSPRITWETSIKWSSTTFAKW